MQTKGIALAVAAIIATSVNAIEDSENFFQDPAVTPGQSQPYAPTGTPTGRQEKCHALVMSGGGVNGAWEAGVIWGLTHYGDPKEFQWDVVGGVSAGCINAAGVALWEKGKEQEMA